MSTAVQQGHTFPGGPAVAVCGTRHTPRRQEADMAHIRCTLRRHFTGQIGPVVFTNGHGETDDPETLAYFEANPDEFEVVEGSLPIPQGDSSDPDETDPDTDPQE